MEGSTWESVLGISSLKISNITVIDNNKFTTRDSVIKIKPSLYPLSENLNHLDGMLRIVMVIQAMRY